MKLYCTDSHALCRYVGSGLEAFAACLLPVEAAQ